MDLNRLMWKTVPPGENQFRDLYKRKIIGLIGTTDLTHDYVFEPNHSYDINKIANEVQYLMNQGKKRYIHVNKLLSIRHVPTNLIINKKHGDTMKRIRMLYSCIHNMSEDAIYEVDNKNHEFDKVNVPETKSQFSLYGYYVLLAIAILLLLCIREKPYFVWGVLLLTIIFFL